MMDYYHTLVNQREALAIAVDDARKLRRHLSLIELMAATASAAELIQQGVAPPGPAKWDFVEGWNALCDEIRASYSSQRPGAGEIVRMIAAGDVSWCDADLYIWGARCLRDLLQYGFSPPDPAPSEEFARGWEAACAAFAKSDALEWLAHALADAEESHDARRKTQGRAE